MIQTYNDTNLPESTTYFIRIDVLHIRRKTPGNEEQEVEPESFYYIKGAAYREAHCYYYYDYEEAEVGNPDQATHEGVATATMPGQTLIRKPCNTTPTPVPERMGIYV